MMKNFKTKLFLVDDDALFLKSLEIEFLSNPNFNVETFSSGENCIENLSRNPEIIILDYHLDGMTKNAINGIETLDRIKSNNPEIFVIMLSSQDKIEVAVKCMQHGASDYVVKSETAYVRIQKIITTILSQRKMEIELNWYMKRM